MAKLKSSCFPLLFYPKVYALRNYWRRRKGDLPGVCRDAVLLLFGILLAVGIHAGGYWIIRQFKLESMAMYMHSSLLLGLLLVYLFLMLCISNVAGAFSSLFLSADTDLIYSSPLKFSSFFWGKVFDIVFISAWSTIIYILPMISSFGAFYKGNFGFYLFTCVVLLPYFIIPSSLAMLLVSLYCRFVPASRTKETLAALSVLALISFYFILQILIPDFNSIRQVSAEDMLHFLKILAIPNKTWLPAYWASTCLSEYLEPSKPSFIPHLLLLYSTAGAVLSLAYLALRFTFFEAYSRALNDKRGRLVDSRSSRRFTNKLLAVVPAELRALVVKDFKVLSRDITQMIQVLLLGGLAVIYFYNFRLVHSLQGNFEESQRAWWSGFFFAVNFFLEAFLITAVGTRFIFQSVSLEGRSFWIIQSAPLSLQKFLKTKFFSWYLSASTILGTVFAIGSYASGAGLSLALLKLLSTFIICWGIVGLAIGLGAYFSNFNWEHSSQLIASFGSLVFMFCSVMLVSVDSLGLLICLKVFKNPIASGSSKVSIAIVVALLIALLNYLVARFALKKGEQELIRRQSS